MSLDLLKDAISKDTSKTPLFKNERGLMAPLLAELALPHRRIENWKYTNLNRVFENQYKIEEVQVSEIAESVYKDEVFYHIEIINGELRFCSPELKEYLLFTQDIDKAPSIPMDYFSQDFISILNHSAIKKVAKFTFKKNTVLAKPIFIHYSFDGEMNYHNFNSFIEVGQNCELTILEEIKTKDSCLVNIKSNITVEQNSQLGHTIIQNADEVSSIFIQPSANVAKDSYYSNSVINLGAKLSRTNIVIDLVGENAEADAHGLYLLNGEQHHDTMSYIKHSCAHTFSHQLYKGVLDDKSRGIFSGIIRIDKDSQLVVADQLNKNLLLGQKAQANSRPQLEIYADDVKCAHGSTTGQINQDEVFYFESRGIDKKRANEILAKAFIFDVILKIKNVDVRAKVSQVLTETKKVFS